MQERIATLFLFHFHVSFSFVRCFRPSSICYFVVRVCHVVDNGNENNKRKLTTCYHLHSTSYYYKTKNSSSL